MYRAVSALSALAAVAALPATAEDSTADLAARLSNPVSSLISVPFQYNHNSGLAGGNGTQDFINIQPVIPFSIGEDWNVVSRTVIPVVSLDGVPAGTGQTSGLGNIVQSFFFSPRRRRRAG
ncbi:hypothetical protein [Albidovulum sp.]|uniref:hypothetical protein n=1 Tax=Albidovulum sp. TaxID=1872424 RepID=UPI0039B8822D